MIVVVVVIRVGMELGEVVRQIGNLVYELSLWRLWFALQFIQHLRQFSLSLLFGLHQIE